MLLLLSVLAAAQLGAPRFVEPIVDRTALVQLTPPGERWLAVPTAERNAIGLGLLGTLVGPESWVRVHGRLPTHTGNLALMEMNWLQTRFGYGIGKVVSLQENSYRDAPGESALIELRRDDGPTEPEFAAMQFFTLGERRFIAATGPVDSAEGARRVVLEGLRGVHPLDGPPDRVPAGMNAPWQETDAGWAAGSHGLEDALSGLRVTDSDSMFSRFVRAPDVAGRVGLVTVIGSRGATIGRVPAPRTGRDGNVLA